MALGIWQERLWIFGIPWRIDHGAISFYVNAEAAGGLGQIIVTDVTAEHQLKYLFLFSSNFAG